MKVYQRISSEGGNCAIALLTKIQSLQHILSVWPVNSVHNTDMHDFLQIC